MTIITDQQQKSRSDRPASLAEAWYLRSQDELSTADAICRSVLSHNPSSGEAWHLLGLIAMDQKAYARAISHLNQAVAIEPNQPLHHNNLGVVLNTTKAYARAAASFEKALALDPAYTDAKLNLGLARYHQNELDGAAACFKEILSRNPLHDSALANLGMTYLGLQNPAGAVLSYEKAIEIDPSRSAWHGNLAAAYMRMGHFKQAVQSYQRAIEINGNNLNFHVNMGIALRAAGDLRGSINALEVALSMAPRHARTLANLVVGLEYTCQWQKLDRLYPLLDAATKEALRNHQAPDEDPMLNIRRCSDVEMNQSVARAWSRRIAQQAVRVRPCFSHGRAIRVKQPITIGYLSNDFRNHPVAHQLYPLFQLHDRNRYRVLAFSMGSDDGSCFYNDIASASDEFIDISACGLAEAAQLIHERQVDILVDLMGHSHHHRMGILALRPAPVQVSYMGYLSTTGADYIDYIIADPIVVPVEHTPFYDEKLIRLPHCYQLNHLELIDPTSKARLAAWGLPENAFIFCCFNNTYKIDRALFDTWIRILKACPTAVLWLCATHETAVAHMKSYAAQSGIASQRLIFADKIPLEKHLQRLPLAHLALDTTRYNGGATTANALSVGLPVLTTMGNHWVSRMSASHLIGVGLHDLVCKDIASYEKTAIYLALNPDKLHLVRGRLKSNIKSHALFNTKGYVRHLESGYESIWRRYQNNRTAAHIEVPDSVKSTTCPDNIKENHLKGLPASNPIGTGIQASRMASRLNTRQSIFYCCPDSTEQSAGIRRLYRHVALLNAAGFQASILHDKEGFQRHDLYKVPVQYLNRIGDDPQSIFVIPEGMPGIMHRLKEHPGRRLIIALSWHYIFTTLPEGMDWRQMNIERVLTPSAIIAELVSWSMDLPVHQIATSVDHKLYRYDPCQKQLQIAYIERKVIHIEKLMSLLGARNSAYTNKIKWLGLDGVSERDYADEICKSSVFLTTSMAEGCPTGFWEAMAAGAIVAGYDAVGGRQRLCGHGPEQNCILAPSGDYVSLAYQLAPLLDDLLTGHTQKWANVIANAQKTVSGMTFKNERDTLIAFFHRYAAGYDNPNHQVREHRIKQMEMMDGP